ncbi:hypothetical protein BGY98DRAFT_1188227 [Russula aff. rugulosa BPL654]|nr:hypothetical protein BGY98DRAFT_1188227 [Russula aff. rugulosa BPL654]
MESTESGTDQQHQGTFPVTERSPNLTINRLPDEVLLEIFDSYRQNIHPYDHHWRRKYVWLDLAHVCRRWRAVIFASSSRLDLKITVGPKKPGHIETILRLSSPLPIFIEYKYLFGDITGSALWRMRAALRHRDRVREIYIDGLGVSGVGFGKFIRATNHQFPALESLILYFPRDHEQKFQPHFSEDQINQNSSSTANAAIFDSSQESLLLACLQGMQCLRSLNLITPGVLRDSHWRPASQHSTPKDIVPLLNLSRFHYSGPTIFLNNLMSGLSAPSLQDARFVVWIRFPLLFLSRVINDVRGESRSVRVTFNINLEQFCLSSWTHLGEIDRFKPSFRLKFRSVRVLRVDPFMREVALYLQQDDGEGILPVLEEIELSISHLTGYSDEECRAAEELAAFEPFISARERAGRLVKVYHCEQTPAE